MNQIEKAAEAYAEVQPLNGGMEEENVRGAFIAGVKWALFGLDIIKKGRIAYIDSITARPCKDYGVEDMCYLRMGGLIVARIGGCYQCMDKGQSEIIINSVPYRMAGGKLEEI